MAELKPRIKSSFQRTPGEIYFEQLCAGAMRPCYVNKRFQEPVWLSVLASV